MRVFDIVLSKACTRSPDALALDAGVNYAMNISEYRSYVAQVRKSAINCFVGRCQVPACSANLEVHTPTFVNAIRLDNGDNPYTYQDAGWANDAGSANNRADLVATGLLRFRVLPGRHATIVLTVVMIDEGGNHSNFAVPCRPSYSLLHGYAKVASANLVCTCARASPTTFRRGWVGTKRDPVLSECRLDGNC